MDNNKFYKKVSKTISYGLRHCPEELCLNMDENGWVKVSELLDGLSSKDIGISKQELEMIVSSDEKQRYSFNENKTMIRANQGHSINVDLQLQEAEPPEFLYHGTSDRFIDNIMNSGIMSMSRQYVHLSNDVDTAKKVGSRHGKPVVIKIKALQAYKDNVPFYLSENKIWLTNFIDKKYLEII